MYDWKIWFINPNTHDIDYLNMSSKYSKDRVKEEFHSVFPGVKIKEINRQSGFKAEAKLRRMRAARKAKKAKR